MGDEPGYLLYRNVMRKVTRIEQLPERILRETERRFPACLHSLPDESWGVFQTSLKVYKAERKPAPVGEKS